MPSRQQANEAYRYALGTGRCAWLQAMAGIMIILPWPSPDLSQNSRCHWAVKAKAAKAARGDACWAAKASRDRVAGTGVIDLHISFYPPSKRRYDLDGLLSRLKSALDGIADGLGVDDNRFTLRIERCAPIKGGEVRIVVTG